MYLVQCNYLCGGYAMISCLQKKNCLEGKLCKNRDVQCVEKRWKQVGTHYGGVKLPKQSGPMGVDESKSVQAHEANFLTIFCYLSTHLEPEELEWVATVAQKIWFRRNPVVFEGVVLPPLCLLKCTINEVAEYRKAQENPRSRPPEPSAKHTFRTPPSSGRIKLN
jgi:hypothetical protein